MVLGGVGVLLLEGLGPKLRYEGESVLVLFGFLFKLHFSGWG